MVQFMKAMRDDNGDMIRNAHILGFFRRICKLLFLRVKPVFVFDGATPALKRRTVAARRKHRDNAQAKIRKTAEKLLLNHLKTKRLEELAKESKSGKGKEKADTVVLEQERLDEMLAASLAAEEEKRVTGKEAASTGEEDKYDDEDDDGDEEMIFPVTSGKIDPTVLASLPPSMQLDLLVQMRERLMAENRQKYQKIKKTPTKFSELQIQSYLKTVAFRREINEVQKSATGRGLGGLQTSRIASEANREFIFSSSFTGDKQVLSSTRVGNNGDDVHLPMQQKPIPPDPVNRKLFSAESIFTTEASTNEVTSDFGNDVETYHDDKGHLRVSRVRGLGIRMTRDLQRNLDLMKEYEQENNSGVIYTRLEPECTKNVSESAKCFHAINSPRNSSGNKGNNRSIGQSTGSVTGEGGSCCDELPLLGSKVPIEISFLEDDSGMKDADDKLFLNLVSGNPPSKFSGIVHSEEDTDDSESECIWEEGAVDDKPGSWKNDQNKESQSYLIESKTCAEDEVEWEGGVSHVPKAVSHFQADHEKSVSHGMLEEEADIQEAIRRSLQDTQGQKSSNLPSANVNVDISSEDQGFVGFLRDLTSEGSRGTHLPLGRHPESVPSPCATEDGCGHLEYPSRKDMEETVDSPKNHLTASAPFAVNFDGKSSAAEGKNEELDVSTIFDVKSVRASHSNDVTIEGKSLATETTNEEFKVSSRVDDNGVSLPQTKNALNDKSFEHDVIREELGMDTSKSVTDAQGLRILNEDSAKVNYEVGTDLADSQGSCAQASQSCHFLRRIDEKVYSQKDSSGEEKVVNTDIIQEKAMVKDSSIPITESQNFRGNAGRQEAAHNQDVISEVDFDEEISILRQERRDLGDEQRKLERNAESVSSEMFAECQELLQMFGLPYIIAPMEAEAQCAYMEMTGLVDGVVTDDSDVFLFGARSIYKNIFDDRKYVETYFMKDIESELGLNRESLIRMALLLGSDYTEGVSGIGIVNAIEVVRAFPEEDGLQKFREWIETPDPALLQKLGVHTGSNSKRRSSKANNKDADGMRINTEVFASEDNGLKGDDDQPSRSDLSYVKEVFMNKHRNLSKNWHLPSSFPSRSVITAYNSPQVDESTESFSWGKPDLFLLRKLCWDRFGWSNNKADELLVPVLKEYNKHETQLRLEAFYTFNERFAKIRSKRIKKAVKGITGKCFVEPMDDLLQQCSSSGKKREDCSVAEKCDPGNRSDGKDSSVREVSKRLKRQNVKGQNMQSDKRYRDSLNMDEGGRIDKSRLSANERGRGGGRGRGRERRRGRGREEKPNHQTSASSSSGDHGDADEMEKYPRASKATPELRRSMRHRKHVTYAEKNEEICEQGSEEAVVERKFVEEGSSDTVGDVPDRKDRGNGCPEESFSGFRSEERDRQCEQNHPTASPTRHALEKHDEVGDGHFSALNGENELPTAFEEDSESREYLLNGGGFCMDENNTQVDTVRLDASLVRQDLKPSDRAPKQPTRESSPGAENVHPLHPQDAGGRDETKLGLSAMPSLKRKRRKV